MRQRAWYAFAVGTVVLIGAFSITNARQDGSETSATPLAIDEGPMIAPGDPPDFSLIYTGGVVGYVEPCG